MANLLTNGDFNGGWTRKTHTGQEFGEIFVPDGWTAYWDENAGRPEMHVINNEVPYLDPPRIYEPPRAVKWFTFYRNHIAGIYQTVTGLLTGARYRFSAYVHAWYSQRDDPQKSEYQDADSNWQEIHNGDDGMDFVLFVDPYGGSDPFFAICEMVDTRIYNTYAQMALEFIAAGDTVTVFIESRTLYPFKHCDAYVDNAVLELIAEPEPPQPGVDYVVVVELLPQDATLSEKGEVLERTHADRRTILQSADDAARLVAPGLPGSRVEAWGAERWPGDIVAWLHEHGVDDVLLREFWESPPDPDLPPPPVVPPTGEPTPWPLRSTNLLGLHCGFVRKETESYTRYGKPTCMKFFSAGDAWRAGTQWGPGTVILWRKFVGDPGISDPPAQAKWLLDQYTAEIETARANLGLTVEQLLGGISALESLNETIPTFNKSVIERGVEVDVRFAEALWARYGNLVGPGLLNVAIGNPHETEVQYLLPAAKAVVKYGGLIDYHGYWTGNRTQNCIADNWQWHAGRWMEWDKVFTAAGVYPRYVATEGGVVYADNCTVFHSGLGWRDCGSFERYIADMRTYRARVLAWNAQHANRCAGVTVFGYGNWGWDSFELGDGEVRLMAAEFGAPIPATYAAVTDNPQLEYIFQFEEYLRGADYLSPEQRARLRQKLSAARSAYYLGASH